MTPLLRVALSTAVIVIIILRLRETREKKKAGKWKRPWSYPVAMSLQGVALGLMITTLTLTVGEYFGWW